MASLLFAMLLSASFESQAEEGILDFLFGPSASYKAGPLMRRAVAPRRSTESSARSNNQIRPHVHGQLRFVRLQDDERASGHQAAHDVSRRANPERAIKATTGYCVRACDGYFFPLNKSRNATREQSCKLTCPSAPMAYYSGIQIDRARNEKGESYASLPTAFRFRDTAVQNCECNSLDATEEDMVRSSRSDPTLRPGDVVVAVNGPILYRGGNDAHAFVSVEQSSLISSETRRRLRALFQNRHQVDRIEFR